MTSRCNRNTVHALTTNPTHPKFGKAIICRLSQKITPQVRRPVIVAIHVRVNKIHVCNKYLTTSNPAPCQITKPHPPIQQYKGQKQVTLSPSTPQSKPHIPQTPTKQTTSPHPNGTTPKIHVQPGQANPQPYFFMGNRTPNP